VNLDLEGSIADWAQGTFYQLAALTVLCNGMRMPIMMGNGLGCRDDAAEIKPNEPVWVIPAKGAAGCRIS
jgi:hypothetical protein